MDIKIKIKNNRKGAALIIALMVTNLLLFLVSYMISFTLTEKKISLNQSWGAKTYYLSEAGIAEMVWKLKNDQTYKNNFETDPNWTATIDRTDPFGPGSGSYTITIQNNGRAHGTINAIGKITIDSGKTSQRQVQVKTFKALGDPGEIADKSAYSDGNIDISGANVNIYDGDLHSNNNIHIKGFSHINATNNIMVNKHYTRDLGSTVDIDGELHSLENPPAAEEIEMPAVDFDSNSSSSYKNRANVTYSQAAFENLTDNNANVTLNNDITYVNGKVNLNELNSLTVNGLLVINGDLEIGTKTCWLIFCCGDNNITVNHTSGKASGILAKKRVKSDVCAGNININGVLYSNDQMDINNVYDDFNIHGGIYAQKLNFSGFVSLNDSADIYYDEPIVTETLGAAETSPVITIEHWEEEY